MGHALAIIFGLLSFVVLNTAFIYYSLIIQCIAFSVIKLFIAKRAKGENKNSGEVF